jgi:hypothetical protein
MFGASEAETLDGYVFVNNQKEVSRLLLMVFLKEIIFDIIENNNLTSQMGANHIPV